MKNFLKIIFFSLPLFSQSLVGPSTVPSGSTFSIEVDWVSGGSPVRDIQFNLPVDFDPAGIRYLGEICDGVLCDGPLVSITLTLPDGVYLIYLQNLSGQATDSSEVSLQPTNRLSVIVGAGNPALDPPTSLVIGIL